MIKKVKTAPRLLKLELATWERIFNNAINDVRTNVPESFAILVTLEEEINKLRETIEKGNK